MKVTAQGPWSIAFEFQESEPATSISPTLSGTGNTIDFVSLESGRYVVTATINGSFRIESVFGESYHRMSESRLSVDNPYAFRLNVGEHLAEGKQLVKVTAQGPWSIAFDRQ